MKKDLWCPVCKEFPDEIVEKYIGELGEIRKWNGECYELVYSNQLELRSKDHCSECDSVLEEKGG
jgi:hypothetical protein